MGCGWGRALWSRPWTRRILKLDRNFPWILATCSIILAIRGLSALTACAFSAAAAAAATFCLAARFLELAGHVEGPEQRADARDHLPGRPPSRRRGPRGLNLQRLAEALGRLLEVDAERAALVRLPARHIRCSWYAPASACIPATTLPKVCAGAPARPNSARSRLLAKQSSSRRRLDGGRIARMRPGHILAVASSTRRCVCRAVTCCVVDCHARLRRGRGCRGCGAAPRGAAVLQRVKAPLGTARVSQIASDLSTISACCTSPLQLAAAGDGDQHQQLRAHRHDVRPSKPNFPRHHLWRVALQGRRRDVGGSRRGWR